MPAKTRPWSAWSNVSYLGAAAAVLTLGSGPLSWIVAGSLVALAAGSFYYHSNESPETVDYDHAAMHAVYGSLATVAMGLPWPIVLLVAILAPVVAEFWHNLDIKGSMTLYIGAIIGAAGASGAWLPLIAGLAPMGLGYLAWHRHTDKAHALWHTLTGAGTIGLWLAAWLAAG